MKFTKTLILASKSPRRSQLLTEAGFEFEIRTKEIKEDYPDDLPSIEVAKFLAKKKAAAFQSTLGVNEVVLTADTVVIHDNKIFGKPIDRAEAIKTIQLLENDKHQVITGVCLLSNEKEVVFDSVSHVHLSSMSSEEIEYYVDKFEPYDKAGSYAIQEWIGLCKISKIEGTQPNIVGLPIDKVYEELMKF